MRRHFYGSPTRWIGWILLGIIGFTAFAFLFGAVIMWLWNWLMPVLFHLAIINYWQAVGLALLARLLFGSISHGGSHKGHCKSKHYSHSFGHGNSFGNKWSYYEQYWNEEGEKSFQEYISKKSEGSSAGMRNE